MNAYTVTYHFEYWSGRFLDTTILAQNEYQAERLANEKISRKFHNFMVKHGIDDIRICSVKLIAENIRRGEVFV